MRRKKNRRGDIIIDLTSLLDVILILLLVVLCAQGGLNNNLDEQIEAAEKERAIAKAEYELYSDMLDTEDSLAQLVWSASIVVPYDKNEITKREIRLLVKGEEIETFDLVGNAVDEDLEKFRESLKNHIASNSERPVIISLNENDENILYRDEVKINEILNELSGEFDNVYIKGQISEDNP